MSRKPVQSVVGDTGHAYLPALDGGGVGLHARQPLEHRALATARKACDADFSNRLRLRIAILNRYFTNTKKRGHANCTISWPGFTFPRRRAAMCDHWMPALTLPLTPSSSSNCLEMPLTATNIVMDECLSGLVPGITMPCSTWSREPNLTPSFCAPWLAHDWEALIPVFADAFQNIQPFGSLDAATRLEAAQQALTRTRLNRDGPWIAAASLVALCDDVPAGAILVTLLPEGNPCDWDSYSWQQPPPADCVDRCLGQPHLTWVFVRPSLAGRGVGTALLNAAVNRLHERGFRRLLTTFMIGNDVSTLWHWRNGFQLLAYPGSRRQLQLRQGAKAV